MTDTTKQLPAPIAKEQPTRQKVWPVWVIAIIALISVAALAFWNWQQWNVHQTTMQSLESLKQDTAQLENLYGDRGSQQGQRLQSLEDKLTSQRELIATQQRQIDHNARELLEAGNRTRTDWLLAEAEYLLRIANQRLLIEKDIRGALSALEATDEVLTESDDIGVYPVRQQLAREILALRGITGVDRTGLYLTLEAAIDSVHQLTDQALISEQAPGFVGNGQSDADPGEGGEPGIFARGWTKFKSTLMQVVVVRRLDESVKPLLSPDQSAYARLNLQLMLEEAEMAVLRGNQPLYERALVKAQAAVDDWYDASNPRVSALSSTLAELATRNVAPELPDISKSLELLKQRLAGRLNNDNGGDDS
ncbi:MULTISPECIES: uroporphyrinogen-III C-methyltransferase [unclassified Marinobacter]|uniref:uroporphyrinogen-III C-methyltransferase n=1 Tax=unclassified Marinobacter TaxID=83889 RepID=UPI0026E1EE50|nr:MULTISPECIES: uroporphyrinogen-III C-methyltransferase [unclassified Marinobacter]MDO6443517.1 uroporphyrinogen-III C-methyltransferase [Marinobacter sp. 2_MG-2023]MDO6824098.1 uroporphyrinogen-III C-methyltransferase [Marinobacter sp. 1_MG-2023]